MELPLSYGLPELFGNVVRREWYSPRLDISRRLPGPLSQFVIFDTAVILEVNWVQSRISQILPMLTTRNDTLISRKLNLSILENA